MSTELVKLTINGKEFHVPKGARLIDVCREKGYDIPSFCYYADLALQASCRMCLVRIENGGGRPDDAQLLLDLCDNIEGKSFCPLGDAAAWPIQSAVKRFPEDFEKRLTGKRKI